MPSLGEEGLYQVALGYLKYRPRSEREIRERLHRAGASPGAQDVLVSRLKTLGLVDDSAFARFWRQSREAAAPRSRRLLELELRRKGVSPQDISQALADFSEEEMAFKAARQRKRNLEAQDFASFTVKLGEYLRRRGFSFEVCYRLARQLWEEKRLEGSRTPITTNKSSQEVA